MKYQTKSNKGFTLIELTITIAIVGILSFSAILSYSKFVKDAMISEGKMLVSNIVKVERLYQAENGTYYELLNASYSAIPEIDSRFNKYFNTFSVRVPGDVTDSTFTVVTTSEQNILAGVEVILHAFESKSSILIVNYTGLTEEEIQTETDTDTDTDTGNGNENNGNGNNNDGDDNNQGGGQEKNGNNGQGNNK